MVGWPELRANGPHVDQGGDMDPVRAFFRLTALLGDGFLQTAALRAALLIFRPSIGLGQEPCQLPEIVPILLTRSSSTPRVSHCLLDDAQHTDIRA